jgi:hypothetical protein
MQLIKNEGIKHIRFLIMQKLAIVSPIRLLTIDLLIFARGRPVLLFIPGGDTHQRLRFAKHGNASTHYSSSYPAPIR